MASRYWVGGSGSWNNTTTHWSASSGGAGGASVPTSADDVFFNAASGGGTVTVANLTCPCKNLTLTGFTGSFLSGIEAIEAYGNVVLSNIVLQTHIRVASTTANQTLQSNGASLSALTVQKSGFKLTLLDDLVLTGGLSVTFGELDASGFKVSSPSITTDPSTTVDLGGGLWTFTGTHAINSVVFGGAVTADVSEIVLNGTFIFDGGNNTFHDVTINDNVSLLGSNTFHDVTISMGVQATFEEGTVTEVNSLSTTGRPGALVTLRSSAAGVSWGLVSATAVVLSYAAISDCSATDTTYTANESVDAGNNVGWIFVDVPLPDPNWSALGRDTNKEIIFKVRKPDGTFVKTWTQVSDDPMFTERINQAGTTMSVYIARSPNNTTEVRANIITEGGDPITTEDGSHLIAVYETSNSVGDDTDIELGYLVDVYAYYGDFGRLLTQDGDPITTEDGEALLVANGAPSGVRIFSGKILDYDSAYGETSGVIVTLVSHGYELSHAVVKSGSDTTVSYSSQPLETTLKSVLDTNQGRMSYASGSISATGVNAAMKFQLNTKLEAIKTIYGQTPDDWYWLGNVADNLIYMQAISAGYDHVFVVGEHIKSMRVKRSLEGLVNLVYFVGGEVTPGLPSTTLYKKYEDTASQTAWGVGLERITDRRFTVAANAQRRAEKAYQLSPVFTSPVVISAAKYDIESIRVGQTVGFVNAGNFLDDLEPMVIVSRGYAKNEVSLQLGGLLERQVDIVSGIQEDLSNEQYEALPSAPS